MKLTICDDEQHIREYIADCVRTVSSDVEIEMMPDAEKIMSPDFDADILFLDILDIVPDDFRIGAYDRTVIVVT